MIDPTQLARWRDAAREAPMLSLSELLDLARTALPGLLELMEQLNAEVERLRSELAEHKGAHDD